ncbi:uncharacterized protein L3040_002624 [Drepanopeziza brunnea f. sp. 'multigermtubi']|uniref:uncharacterized protein n=1 Tax=Drepanopeziza brunnea f. sp. 'multigermtubi' TaxID=698441 RepID=UPI0023A4BF3A|nr:hypothetical protein L3040_002624 [Drepanopeziza brunnea f. sp. 'multigermtubi']
MLWNTLIFLFPLLSLVYAANVDYTKVSLTSSGDARYYLVTTPPKFDPKTPTPVIFSFHGKNKSAKDQYELTLLSDPYFNDYAIAVYPNGLEKSWQGHPDATSNDLQFTLDILASLQSRYTLDDSRIYASGKSLGGGFVGVLACDATLSNKFAAFAPVAGAFYIKNDTKCAPRTIEIPCHPGRAKIPMMEIHGGADGTIKYSGAGRGGECVPWIPHWVRQWAKRNGLAYPGNVSSAVSDDTTLYQFETEEDDDDDDGRDLGLVSHVFDENLDHSWPSTLANADNIAHGDGPASFNASTMIVDFFKKYTLEL